MACRVGWRCVATCGLRLVVGNFLRLAARVLRVWGVDVLVGGAFFWFLGTQPGGLRDDHSKSRQLRKRKAKKSRRNFHSRLLIGERNQRAGVNFILGF